MASVPQTRAAATPVEWYTPPEIFAALGLKFDLDPCAPPLPAASWIPADVRIGLPDDGLAASWSCPRDTDGDGDCPLCAEDGGCKVKPRVWLNPPYGAQCGRWVGRLAAHGRGIALVFARTDTAWWQRAARLASAVCFIEGRVNFIPGHRDGRRTSASPAPCCLLAYGTLEAVAVARSRLGTTYTPSTVITEGALL